MDQQRLEDEGIGYRCRGCGITVFGHLHDKPDVKLCTACYNDRLRRKKYEAQEAQP